MATFGLGVAVERAPEGGFIVQELAPGGAAEVSGKVFQNDVILSVDGTDVTQLDNIARFIRGPAGSTVELGLRRSTGNVEFVRILRQGTVVGGHAGGTAVGAGGPASPPPKPTAAAAVSTPTTAMPNAARGSSGMGGAGNEDLARRIQSLEALVQSSTRTMLARMEQLDQSLLQRLSKLEQAVADLSAGGSGTISRSRSGGVTIDEACHDIFSGFAKNGGMDLTDEQLKEMFNHYDKNGDGHIDKKELRPLLRDLITSNGLAYTLTAEDEEVVFDALDLSGAGVIEFGELSAAWRDWSASDEETEGRKALIIVDMQNDFLTGSLTVGGGVDCIPRINDLRRRVKFDLIVHTQDWHPADHVSFAANHEGAELFSVIDLDEIRGKQVMWPTHCVQNSEGSEFHKDLVVEESDVIVQKGDRVDVDSYSGFFDNAKGAETPLRRILKKNRIRDVYCVGVAYDFCVGSTALDSKSCGFNTCLVKDCTAAVGKDTEDQMTGRLDEAEVTMCDASEVPIDRFRGQKRNRIRSRKDQDSTLDNLFSKLGQEYSARTPSS